MDKQFMFEAPGAQTRLSDLANVAVNVGAMASRLTQELRTRCTHPDGRRENVAEHSLMLVKVSLALAQKFYPELDAGKVAMYASMHDDVEAYVGDTPTDLVDGVPDYAAKAKRETAGLAQLISEYNEVSPQYAQLMAEYEAQQLPEARFVRIVDKLMVILIHIPNQAIEIKKQGYTAKGVLAANQQIIQKFRNEYPEYAELHDLRLELAKYIGDKFF